MGSAPSNVVQRPSSNCFSGGRLTSSFGAPMLVPGSSFSSVAKHLEFASYRSHLCSSTVDSIAINLPSILLLHRTLFAPPIQIRQLLKRRRDVRQRTMNLKEENEQPPRSELLLDMPHSDEGVIDGMVVPWPRQSKLCDRRSKLELCDECCGKDNKNFFLKRTLGFRYHVKKWTLSLSKPYKTGLYGESKSNIFSKMTTIREMFAHFHKFDKFEGVGFRRWQKKMHFLLSALNMAYVLSSPQPKENETETLEEQRRRNKWENDDYVCCGHILNGMSDPLFEIYQYVNSAKELWDQLESKYISEDASSKKFLISNFNNYKMTDAKPRMEQFHEIQRILGSFKQHNIAMDETFIVSSIIDKLPPNWKDVRNSLKHNKDDMNVEQLAAHLRIEKGIRPQDGQKDSNHPNSSTVNMVEDGKAK
ncbi:hypothetical protein V8G54_018570 [Vigna mungo]|uniref:Zinc finger, CCHC-type n=1 Tax=Vigna mungo TaxID=3915 RepID=A0AAQ3RUR4_VIGMU